MKTKINTRLVTKFSEMVTDGIEVLVQGDNVILNLMNGERLTEQITIKLSDFNNLIKMVKALSKKENS